MTDHVSELFFCSTQAAVDNLAGEGIAGGVHLVGDVMFDVILHYRELAAERHSLEKWGVTEKGSALCTV